MLIEFADTSTLLGSSLPPTSNLKGCDMYEDLGGSKGNPCSKPLNYAYCTFLFKDCRYSSDWPRKTLQSSLGGEVVEAL